MSMLSDRLRHFLTAWCHADLDDDVTELLHSNATFAPWLKDDLTAAIRGGDITPVVGRRLLGIAFKSQALVDDWLRDRWQAWFPSEPYPD